MCSLSNNQTNDKTFHKNFKNIHELLSEFAHLFIYHSFQVIRCLVLTSEHVTYLERFWGAAQEPLHKSET
jgi:hypothetical protein